LRLEPRLQAVKEWELMAKMILALVPACISGVGFALEFAFVSVEHARAESHRIRPDKKGHWEMTPSCTL
jgi:CBS domain containing-hemolysin-like protein